VYHEVKKKKKKKKKKKEEEEEEKKKKKKEKKKEKEKKKKKKAIDTHSEYIILVAFPRRNWLCERALQCYVIRTLPDLF